MKAMRVRAIHWDFPFFELHSGSPDANPPRQPRVGSAPGSRLAFLKAFFLHAEDQGQRSLPQV